jgi:hypothetical protein
MAEIPVSQAAKEHNTRADTEWRQKRIEYPSNRYFRETINGTRNSSDEKAQTIRGRNRITESQETEVEEKGRPRVEATVGGARHAIISKTE